MTQDVFHHGSGDQGLVPAIRLPQQQRLSGRLCRQGQRSKCVHDQVHPQHLHGFERRILWRGGSHPNVGLETPLTPSSCEEAQLEVNVPGISFKSKCNKSDLPIKRDSSSLCFLKVSREFSLGFPIPALKMLPVSPLLSPGGSDLEGVVQIISRRLTTPISCPRL